MADRSKLLAAFNAGFLLTQSSGGWFSDGLTADPLLAGAASLVLRDDGRADVGEWGRDVSSGPHVIAVRQNLRLLVDNGVATPNSSNFDFEGVWGRTIAHRVAVWRSGIGVTSRGRLVYVAGKDLTIGDLAVSLVANGAVRAMELDINTQWVNAFTYSNGPVGPIGSKLLPTLLYGPEHYLSPQKRDFVAVLAP